MAYSDFTLTRVLHEFGLTVDTGRDLFSQVVPVPLGPTARQTVEDNTPLAVLMHTEKARSELLVAPVLAELWRRTDHRISLYSGATFNVDSQVGLAGVCDFLIGRAPQLPDVTPPFFVVVEAKRDDIPGSYGQCAAEMVAALRVNREHETGVDTVYGCVTTGSIWRFMKLTGTHLEIDLREYYVHQPDRVFGILLFVVGANPQAAAA
ncbi:MAG: hypothetical protein K2P78_03185 [Gemmataceae bacterium]|nr:hypothetical protein [Gemmataceae bacterium]